MRFVVINHEEQYSIWPEYKENPLGWKDVGKAGPKAECLAYIKEVWTDMRPLSLRKKMEEMAKDPPPPVPPDSNAPREKSLVDRLCEGDHPVEVGLRPERTVKLFKEAIDRNYVHIRFTEVWGGEGVVSQIVEPRYEPMGLLHRRQELAILTWPGTAALTGAVSSSTGPPDGRLDRLPRRRLRRRRAS
jgi:uncharacterized protein YbdZ (MbtH family)